MTRWLAVALFLLLAPGAPAPLVAQEPPQEAAPAVAELFERANALMEARKPAEALPLYLRALEQARYSEALLYNGGLAAYLTRDFALAAELWERLALLAPEEWQVLPKLIQAYQALGRLEDRDRLRRQLFEWRASGRAAELAEAEFYCREQFERNGRRVLVFEHFELQGDRALKYVFLVLNAEETDEDFRISLGSYELTHQMVAGSGRLPPGQRLHHLDGYFHGGRTHETYGFYYGEPTYDEIRARVIEILEGKVKPVSSSTAAPREETKPDTEVRH